MNKYTEQQIEEKLNQLAAIEPSGDSLRQMNQHVRRIIADADKTPAMPHGFLVLRRHFRSDFADWNRPSPQYRIHRDFAYSCPAVANGTGFDTGKTKRCFQRRRTTGVK